MVGADLGSQISFVGPFGVGETAAAVNACTTQLLMTEVPSSSAEPAGGKHRKPATTVRLEIGEMGRSRWSPRVNRRHTRQERFDMIRRSAMPPSDAIVLWLFGAHPQALEDAVRWLELVSKEIAIRKLVVAVTRLADDAALEPCGHPRGRR